MSDPGITARPAQAVGSPQYPDFSDEEPSRDVQVAVTIEGQDRQENADNRYFATQNCYSCRKKKRKCDRALPTCRYCDRTKSTCEYAVGSSRSTSSQSQTRSATATTLDSGSQYEPDDSENEDAFDPPISSNLDHIDPTQLYPGQEFANLTDFKRYVFEVARVQGFQPYLRRSDRRGAEVRCHSLPNPHKPRSVEFNRAGCQFRVSARTWPEERKAKADMLQDVVWNTPGRWGDGTEPARITMVQPIHICGMVNRTGMSSADLKHNPRTGAVNGSRQLVATHPVTHDSSPHSGHADNLYSLQRSHCAISAVGAGQGVPVVESFYQDEDGDTVVEESDFEEHVPMHSRKRKGSDMPESQTGPANVDGTVVGPGSDALHSIRSMDSNKRHKDHTTFAQSPLACETQPIPTVMPMTSSTQLNHHSTQIEMIESTTAGQHNRVENAVSRDFIRMDENRVGTDQSAWGDRNSTYPSRPSNDSRSDSTIDLGEEEEREETGHEQLGSHVVFDRRAHPPAAAIHGTQTGVVMHNAEEPVVQQDGNIINQHYTHDISVAGDESDRGVDSTDNSMNNLMDPKYFELLRHKRSLQFRYIRAILKPSNILKNRAINQSRRHDPVSPPLEPKYETPFETLKAENYKLERASIEAEKKGAMDQAVLVDVLQDMVEKVGRGEVRRIMRIAMGEV